MNMKKIICFLLSLFMVVGLSLSNCFADTLPSNINLASIDKLMEPYLLFSRSEDFNETSSSRDREKINTVLGILTLNNDDSYAYTKEYINNFSLKYFNEKINPPNNTGYLGYFEYDADTGKYEVVPTGGFGYCDVTEINSINKINTNTYKINITIDSVYGYEEGKDIINADITVKIDNNALYGMYLLSYVNNSNKLPIKDAYIKILKQNSAPNFYYTLYDMNKDGTPELITTKGDEYSKDMFPNFFYYENGNAKYAGHLEEWKGLYAYDEGNGMLIGATGTDYGGLIRIYIENGYITYGNAVVESKGELYKDGSYYRSISVNGKIMDEYMWKPNESAANDSDVFDETNYFKMYSKELNWYSVNDYSLIDSIKEINNISVFLNGNELSFEQPPYIENGTTRVPMRYISEALGSEVNYNAQTKTITIRKGSTIIELITGSNIARINGREMTLTTPVENRNGYTMVPLRFISEAFGAEVIWDGENQIITINLAEKSYPLYYNNIGYNVIPNAINENNIKDNVNLNIKKIQPFIGLSKTMMETVGDAEYNNNYEVAGDTFEFILSWINNSIEITKLNITTGKNNTMNIKFGSPIESNYSGKKLSLDSLLVDKYYDYSPSIIFKSSDKADECIRNWFGLTGNGKYTMELNFGKVLLSDYGYYIVINGKNDIYQVPIINKNTTMKVYYTENGKTEFVFDAADKLREAKLPVKDDVKNEIINQLEDNNFTFNKE